MRYCPKANCDGVMRAKSVEDLKLTCPACKSSICFKCRDEWHGYWTSCEKHMMSKFDDKIKFCPVCFVKISRTEGCNHMTCTYCKYDWCWVCNGEGTSDHWNPMNPFGCGATMMQ